MKSIVKKKRLLFLLPVLLILAWPIYQLGTALTRELSFWIGSPTPAEVTVHAYAAEKNIAYSDYPFSLIQLLDRNPEAEAFVLEYPLKKDLPQEVDLDSYRSSDAVPLFLQWDQRWGYLHYGSDVAGITGCGPLCLSMAAFYLTGSDDYAPDKMLSFAAEEGYYAAGYGSSWTLISEGAAKLGFDVTELPLVKGRIFSNLEAGNPVICVMGPGDFTTTGHFVVMTGLEDGYIRINDPNSIANSQKLWRYEDIEGQIRNLWAIRN